MRSRALVVAVLVLVGAVVLAAPAGAVTPRPTDYRSSVEAIEPAAPIAVSVVGGDTLLELRVAPGHEAVVEGYAGEPYLRVGPDGTVQVNRRSPAVALNQQRDAGVGGTDASANTGEGPDWQTIGHDGTAIWHDHRIHVQNGARYDGVVPWTVGLTVDGNAVTVKGQLVRVDPPSPLPYLLVALAVAAMVWLAGRHRARYVASAGLLIASVLAAGTGAIEWVSLPSAVARNPGLFLLPIGAAAGAVTGALVRRRTAALVALLASVALLSGWLAFRWSILTRSVLVSDLAPVIDRITLAVVAGVALAAAGLVVEWAGTPDRAPSLSRA